MELTGVPRCSVNSARALLHRPRNRLQMIFRKNGDGKLGLLGGKVAFRERPKTALARELLEEGRFAAVTRLAQRTILCMPDRVIPYPVTKLKELGYDVSDLEAAATAVPDAAAPERQILLANPLSLIYSGVTDEALPAELVEGCSIVELDLRKEKSLKQIKARYRVVITAWRLHVLHDAPMPRCLLYEGVR